MENGYRLSSDEIAEVKQLKKENLSNKEIGRRLCKSSKIIDKYFANQESNEKNLKGCTETEKTEAASVKTIQESLKNRKKSLKEKLPVEKKKQPSKYDAREEKRKAERAAKMEQMKLSKAKRAAKNKIISKKTKRGQPLMKDRIEFLLNKIQSSKN